MTQSLYRNLSWLPAAPEDFSSECRAIFDEPSDAGVRLRQLADHALTDRQLAQLATSVSRAHTLGIDLESARSIPPWNIKFVDCRLFIVRHRRFCLAPWHGSRMRNGGIRFGRSGSALREFCISFRPISTQSSLLSTTALCRCAPRLEIDPWRRSCVRTALQYFETVRRAAAKQRHSCLHSSNPRSSRRTPVREPRPAIVRIASNYDRQHQLGN